MRISFGKLQIIDCDCKNNETLLPLYIYILYVVLLLYTVLNVKIRSHIYFIVQY